MKKKIFRKISISQTSHNRSDRSESSRSILIKSILQHLPHSFCIYQWNDNLFSIRTQSFPVVYLIPSIGAGQQLFLKFFIKSRRKIPAPLGPELIQHFHSCLHITVDCQEKSFHIVGAWPVILRSRVIALAPGLGQGTVQAAAVLKPGRKKTLSLMKSLEQLGFYVAEVSAETAEAAGNTPPDGKTPMTRWPAEQVQSHRLIRTLIAAASALTENRQKIKAQPPLKDVRSTFQRIYLNHLPAAVFPGGIPEVCAVVGETGKRRGHDICKKSLKLWSGKFKNFIHLIQRILHNSRSAVRHNALLLLYSDTSPQSFLQVPVHLLQILPRHNRRR